MFDFRSDGFKHVFSNIRAFDGRIIYVCRTDSPWVRQDVEIQIGEEKMIEILNGLHETINYGDSLGIRLYHNTDYEDYPEHWHTGVEIIMPLHGEYGVIVGARKYWLKEGEIIIINSGVLHSLEAPPTGERAILQFSDYLLYSLKEMETLLALLPPVLYLSEENDPQRLYGFIKRHIDAIIVEYGEEKTFFQAAIYARLIEIFVYLGRSATWGKVKKSPIPEENNPVKKREYMENIMSACAYINQHYQEPISLDEIADASGFSRFHFARIFKQYMHMMAHEYLNQKRITKAEELLSTTAQSITEIALNSGFSSISSFNRTFKAMKGCTPSIYRSKWDSVEE